MIWPRLLDRYPSPTPYWCVHCQNNRERWGPHGQAVSITMDGAVLRITYGVTEEHELITVAAPEREPTAAEMAEVAAGLFRPTETPVQLTPINSGFVWRPRIAGASPPAGLRFP